MIQNTCGIVDRYIGDIIDYIPWDHEWQGMIEQERVKDGLFVHCFGHGEFEVLRVGVDIKECE